MLVCPPPLVLAQGRYPGKKSALIWTLSKSPCDNNEELVINFTRGVVDAGKEYKTSLAFDFKFGGRGELFFSFVIIFIFFLLFFLFFSHNFSFLNLSQFEFLGFVTI